MADPDPYAVGLAVLDRLKQHNDERRALGLMRREEIRKVIDAEPGLTARQVRDKLNDTLSLRTVQLHLQNIRAARRHCAVD